MKKTLSIILTLALILSLGVTALAAPVTKGSITVNNVTEGTVLDAFMIVGYTYDDGNISTADIVDAYTPAFTSVINAAVSASLSDSNIADLPALKDNASDTDIMLWITNNKSADSDFAKTLGNALKAIAADQAKTKSVTVAEGETTATISDLDMGYYLILDKTPYTVDEAVVSVMLQPLNPNAEVNLKTSTFTIPGKTAAEASYSIGENVPYTITLEVPNWSNYATASLEITDELGTGLTYNKDAKIAFGEGTAEAIADVTGVSIAYVDKKAASGSDPEVPASFTITIDNIKAYAIGSKITVTYSTFVNSEADDNGDGLVNGILAHQNGQTLEGVPSKVYTYGFDLTKINEQEEVLEGVEFKLVKTPAVPAVGNEGDSGYVAAVPAVYYTFTKNAQGIYVLDASGSEVLTTDANGYLKVFGLKAGTYQLEETKPLAGYNALPAPVSITLGSVATTVYTHVGTVENTTGIILPGTGGEGITSIAVLGSALLLCAAAIVLLNKKRLFN